MTDDELATYWDVSPSAFLRVIKLHDHPKPQPGKQVVQPILGNAVEMHVQVFEQFHCPLDLLAKVQLLELRSHLHRFQVTGNRPSFDT